MGKGGKKEKKHKSKGKNDFDMGKKKKGRGKGKTKQDKNWDKYFKEFQDSLQPKGIFMRDVEGDGNCLFRSISDYVEGDENNHEKYRNMAVEYITKNKEYFALFLLDDEKIEDYIKDMSEDGTWGGHFELVALSSLLNVKFCLHIKDKEDPVIIKCSEKELKRAKYVHIAYHIDEHYSSVRKIGDDTKEPAEPIPVNDSDSDSDQDSTEESDPEMTAVTKEMESAYISKKGKKQNKKEKEEKKEEEPWKGKYNKNKDKKEKEKEKEEKGKGKHGKKKGK